MLARERTEWPGRPDDSHLTRAPCWATVCTESLAFKRLSNALEPLRGHLRFAADSDPKIFRHIEKTAWSHAGFIVSLQTITKVISLATAEPRERHCSMFNTDALQPRYMLIEKGIELYTFYL